RSIWDLMLAIAEPTRIAKAADRLRIVRGPRFIVGSAGVAPWMADVVAGAGGEIVTDPSQADAVVWTDPYDVDGLKAILAAAPNAGWVQLPWAGVEAYAAAGIFDGGRTWTCGKGVYAEPCAEHALALILAGFRDFPER